MLSPDREPWRPPICTNEYEDRQCHCHCPPQTHLAGPPLGADQEERPSLMARRRARRLVRIAADEATRMAVKAAGSGVFLLYLWWQTRR
ncbi:hypothetical protein GCM10010271_74100 [Streptomyces kurssanovii]|nr:hypothetical protein GCM10010271_74100 [Streptomyces kurssanovii]